MQISFRNHSIALQTWLHKVQMTKFLESCEAGFLLLGENEEQESEFYTLVVYLDNSASQRFGVGICSQGHGLMPHLLLLPEISSLILGFNSEVIGVNVLNKTVDFKVSLETLFYSFSFLYEQKLLLVQHEIGVVMLTPAGEVIWQFTKDIITNIAVTEDILKLEFMDASSVCLDLINGSVSDS